MQSNAETLRKYNKEVLELAVKESNSFAGVLRHLKLNISGSSHVLIKARITEYSLDIMTRPARNRPGLRCLSCNNSSRTTKIQYPPVVEIVKELQKTSYTALSRNLGVSDNAIRKYLKKNGYNPKTLDLL